MLSASDTTTPTSNSNNTACVFLYASHVYYRREEDGVIFSAHIDDLDADDLDIKACGEGVVVPSGATPYDPSDAGDDDVLVAWLDKCDAA